MSARRDLALAEVGMRVRVVVVGEVPDPNLRGTIVRVDPLELEGGGILVNDYPTIRLDDGREVGGIECWWTADWDGDDGAT